ncbi:MAG TPA: riboflavin synthase [Thermodesulfobacteriota bacterium]
MFTGIIEDVGRIASIARDADGARLVIETSDIDAGALAAGESIAVDGACLTVTGVEAGGAGRGGRFSVYVSAETLARTTLGDRARGDRVNLERAMALGDRLGGHIVQGHVDATGAVVGLDPVGESVRLRVSVPGRLARYVVEKGSIAVDGVSLTVNRVDDRPEGDTIVEVNLVPHTLARTALASKTVGARVNIEADILAKHLERLAFFRGS